MFNVAEVFFDNPMRIGERDTDFVFDLDDLRWPVCRDVLCRRNVLDDVVFFVVVQMSGFAQNVDGSAFARQLIVGIPVFVDGVADVCVEDELHAGGRLTRLECCCHKCCDKRRHEEKMNHLLIVLWGRKRCCPCGTDRWLNRSDH